MDGLQSNVPAFDSSELKELKQNWWTAVTCSTEKAFTDGFGHGETAGSRIDYVKLQKENIAARVTPRF
jgi:hypothetical protein